MFSHVGGRGVVGFERHRFWPEPDATSNDNSGAATSGQRTTPSDSGRGTGMTGAPSSSNPQAGGGPGGLTASPHQVPVNGGAPNAVVPNTKR